MSYRDSVKYEPDKSTYAIRIFSKIHEGKNRRPLKESPLYQHVGEYFIDDIIEENEDVDEELSRLLLDFKQYSEGCECILVHCVFGMSRSPAIAIAINEAFGFGNENLRGQHPNYNQLLYQKAIKKIEELA